jgi:hypothetical protein
MYVAMKDLELRFQATETTLHQLASMSSLSHCKTGYLHGLWAVHPGTDSRPYIGQKSLFSK